MHFFGCTDELQDRVASLEIIIPVEEIVGIVSRQESLKAVRRTKSRVEISVGIKGRNRLLKHKDRHVSALSTTELLHALLLSLHSPIGDHLYFGKPPHVSWL